MRRMTGGGHSVDRSLCKALGLGQGKDGLDNWLEKSLSWRGAKASYVEGST